MKVVKSLSIDHAAWDDAKFEANRRGIATSKFIEQSILEALSSPQIPKTAKPTPRLIDWKTYPRHAPLQVRNDWREKNGLPATSDDTLQ